MGVRCLDRVRACGLEEWKVFKGDKFVFATSWTLYQLFELFINYFIQI